MSADAITGLRRQWLWPLLFFQLYLALTVWLFFYGPWPWDLDNPGALVAYLLAAQASIAAGYLGSWTRVRAGALAAEAPVDPAACLHWLKVALVITALAAIPSSLSRTGAIIPDVAAGLGNAGLAYNENFERLESGNPFVVFEYARMLLSPWLTAVFPLTVFCWGRMGPALRVAAIAAIAFNLSIFLATGTNKGIADVVVTLPWLILLAVFAGTLRLRAMRLKLGLAVVVVLAAFLYFFGAGQQQRFGSGAEYGTFFTGAAVLQADSGHFLSALLPEEFRVIFEALTRYVVHGYYALSMALQTDTPSTLGFGHSMFLARNADAVAGTDYFVSQSIPGILERDQGWGMFLLWHSIYPWLASDFGFPGALVVIGLLAYLLGLSWGRSITGGDPRWIVLLYLLLVLFYYVPANNQVFQSGETCVAFFALLWMLRPRRQPRDKAAPEAIAVPTAPMPEKEAP